MNKLWQDEAWADYLYWQQQDKKLLKRINQLLKDIDQVVSRFFRTLVCKLWHE